MMQVRSCLNGDPYFTASMILEPNGVEGCKSAYPIPKAMHVAKKGPANTHYGTVEFNTSP